VSELLEKIMQNVSADKIAVKVGDGLITTEVAAGFNFSLTRDQLKALINLYKKALIDPRLDVHTSQIP